jgi:beta-glucosidase
MSAAEKVAQLFSVWLNISADGSLSFRGVDDGMVRVVSGDPWEILRDGIGQITRPHGTRPMDAGEVVRGLNVVQRFLVTHTRLGIPAIAHEECLAGLMARGATLFPAGINFGSMWDEELMVEVAAAIGGELAGVGARQGLAPVLDVSRDVRWGRTEETFGEDPYLVGCMAVAYVKGLQGGSCRVLATLKHFVGHSFSEGGRNHAPVHVGEKELADVFLLPFEMAVKLANAGSVMPAYHDIDGEPCSCSPTLLTALLRERWGFDGLVVSDYEAVKLLVSHHRVARDEAEAAALALKAGVDMELPGFTCFRGGLISALERGILDMSTLNAAVTRVLVEKSRLGLFENPYVDEGAITLNSPEHRSLAARAAARSMVLLANDGVLPLRDEGTTALIGPLSDDPLAMYCGYSFPVHLILAARLKDPGEGYAKTVRQAFSDRARYGKLIVARGCSVLTKRRTDTPVFPDDADAAKGQSRSYISQDKSGIPEAIDVARQSDRIIAVVGDLSGLFLTGTVGEGSDVSCLTLPGVQQSLLDALLELGKPLVVVLLTGRPYNLGKVFTGANAILEAWLPGQEGADAIVGILYGDINPGGRLPVSFPKSAGAMPYYYNHKLKSPGAPVQSEFGPTFPFGYGLSYTTFRYSDFLIAASEVQTDGRICVSCVVENVGAREGDEVVQLYVRDLFAALVRPVIELKGFARVTLHPGQKRRVTFSLPADMLNYSTGGFKRTVEPGEFEVLIGRSSREVVFSGRVHLIGPVRDLPERWAMETDVAVTDA